MLVNLFSLLLLLIAMAGFVALGHSLARRKGLNPVLWGVMAGVFGPLVLPFLLLTKSRDRHPD